MSESLLVAGVVCIVAAIVGGGVKLLGAEMPVLSSFPRQALLFAVGGAFLIASFQVGAQKPAAPAPSAPAVSQPGSLAPAATPTAPTQSAPAPSGASPCDEATALACLPKSSAPVVFVDEAAANRAAARNIRDGLSTTQAQAAAIRQGASGKASRLCGIVGSNDSSALGKHLAAIRLNNPGPGDGQATPDCLQLAQSFF